MQTQDCIKCERGIPVDRFLGGTATCPWCQTKQDEAGGEVMVTALPAGATHAKVAQRVEGAEQVYTTRQSSWFGWIWLIFTIVHCGFMFTGLALGTVKMNKQLIVNPTVWHFLGLAAFYSLFFAVGFAFTLSRYTVRLADREVMVRYRLCPFVGWTWRLPVGETIRVTLADRGSRQNSQTVRAIVIVSAEKEINFGSFLDNDVKQYLAAQIDGYYNGSADEAAAFIP